MLPKIKRNVSHSDIGRIMRTGLVRANRIAPCTKSVAHVLSNLDVLINDFRAFIKAG
jgi:hypothetical protein